MNKKTIGPYMEQIIILIVGILVAVGVGYMILTDVVDSRVEIEEFCEGKDGLYNMSDYMYNSFYDNCEVNCSDKEYLYCALETIV